MILHHLTEMKFMDDKHSTSSLKQGYDAILILKLIDVM